MKYTLLSIELALYVLYNNPQQKFYSVVSKTLALWGCKTVVIDMLCELMNSVMPKMKVF